MQDLLEVEGVDSVTCSLLEAAGYTNVASLTSNKADVIHTELVKANKMLNIMEQEPSLEQVKTWCGTQVEKVEAASIAEPKFELEHDGVPAIRCQFPIAISLSEDFVENHRIELAQLPQVIRGLGQTREMKEQLELSEEKDLPESQYKDLVFICEDFGGKLDWFL